MHHITIKWLSGGAARQQPRFLGGVRSFADRGDIPPEDKCRLLRLPPTATYAEVEAQIAANAAKIRDMYLKRLNPPAQEPLGNQKQ